jgi:hypothetical protein
VTVKTCSLSSGLLSHFPLRNQLDKRGSMPQSSLGSDWRKSNAHLLLLSKFLHPKMADNFAESDNWKTVLEESPKQAIKRFFDEGMLVQANLYAQLDYKFKATELKNLLKKRALAVSGRKDDLIQRLVQADPGGMKQAVAGLTVLLCSERGRETAEQYLASEKANRSNVEQQILKYLQQHKFEEASVMVASYEAEQIFPRGIGVDWEHHNPAREIAMLNTIFDSKPKILAKLENDKLEDLRLGAAMMALWGKNEAQEWLPSNFETGLSIDVNAAARMFFFYALHQTSLKHFRDSGVVENVEILVAQDSCDACKKLTKRKYKLDEVPELPHEHCTHKMGCRCLEIPIVK